MKIRSVYPGHRWLVLLAGTFVTTTFSINLILLAPILEQVAKDLAVSMATATNLLMAFVLSGAIVATLGGIVCDKWGLTVALVLSSLCAALPATFMPWIGHDYHTVLVLRLVQGSSIGFGMTCLGPILAMWFPPEERGLAGGIMMGGMSIGCSIGVVLSPVIYLFAGSWQRMSSILSIVGWISVILALLTTRRQPPLMNAMDLSSQPVQTTREDVPFRSMLLSPITWIATVVVFFSAWGMQTLLNLVPAYLASDTPVGLGLGPVVAGKLSLGLTMIGILATFVGGVFYDKVAKGDARIPLVLSFLLLAIFAYLLLCPFIYKSMVLLVACLMFAGFWGMFAGPAGNAYVITNFPANVAGRMIGWCFGLGMFGGTMGIWLGGLTVGKTGNFRMAIILISVAAMAGALVGLFARHRGLPALK